MSLRFRTHISKHSRRVGLARALISDGSFSRGASSVWPAETVDHQAHLLTAAIRASNPVRRQSGRSGGGGNWPVLASCDHCVLNAFGMSCGQVRIGAVAFRGKLRQTLALLGQWETDAESQDGCTVEAFIRILLFQQLGARQGSFSCSTTVRSSMPWGCQDFVDTL
jgi:hypothetical protein